MLITLFGITMSLFPAYSDVTTDWPDSSKSENVPKDNELGSWLQNSSYLEQLSSQIKTELSSTSSDEIINDTSPFEKHKQCATFLVSKESVAQEKKRSKHFKKRKRDKRKYDKEKKLQYETDVKNVYFEDKHRDRGFSTVDTLCSRVRPYYYIRRKSVGFSSYKKSEENYERYHVRNIDAMDMARKRSTIIKKGSREDISKEQEDTSSWLANFEELQRNKIKEYNENLTQQPNDVPLWIEYIEFQDQLTNVQSYESAKDGHRATVLKKLSIIQKAVEKNIESRQLLKLMLSLMGELLPADQLSKEIEIMVNKDSGNIVLWQEYIMVTQASVAMCTVPRVLGLYSKCFCVLKQRARTNTDVYDELLQMLYWCLIFLRHAGLWEQMWETIRLNLTLNLSLNKDSLLFQAKIDEKKIIEMEEVILMSRLTLSQLWQRTESLRENCHWISVKRDELELVGDSQRFVLPEDVADFVHPIVSKNSNLRMAVHSLLALKVPLLPTRDYMLRELLLKEFDWGVESSEVLLPFAYPAVGEMAGHRQRKELLNGILDGRLTSGPQYLKFHPAQEPYLDFIREIFRTIAENLPPPMRTSIYIWWLRFERLLIFLHKGDPLKSDNKGKKLRTTLKDFLKRDQNRNNLHFYREYALIEREMGRFESCVNILETALQSQGTCPSAISNLEERAALISLYRTFFETLLDSETYKESHKSRIWNVISQMIPGKSEDQLTLVEQYLDNCVKNFLQTVCADDETETLFIPNYKCDTIMCYAYFLYIKDNDIQKVVNVLTSCIDYYKNSHRIQEMLYESYITLLQLHCERNKEDTVILKQNLKNMINLYPDNFYALSILACTESELPIWKFNSQNTELGLWRAVTMCLASRRRIYLLNQINDSVSMSAAINKLLSFHHTLARSSRTKRCPLLWRLHMLLLREHNLCEKKGEEVYHESVAECPWARSIYIDAAEVAPQLITQVQDVIREKELRMHVTPEELDDLRA